MSERFVIVKPDASAAGTHLFFCGWSHGAGFERIPRWRLFPTSAKPFLSQAEAQAFIADKLPVSAATLRVVALERV
jgi:hypothetical protein